MNAKFTEILVIDDDPITREVIEKILLNNGFQVQSASNGRDGLALLDGPDGMRPDFIFLDVMMPGLDGFGTYTMIRQQPDLIDTPIIFITSNTDQGVIRKCFDIGATDYISKPVREAEIVARISVHLELLRHKQEVNELEQEHAELRRHFFARDLQKPDAFKAVLTVSGKMQSIFQYIESISKTSRPVFITGETGTGKELIAQGTHAMSGRNGHFVPLNVAGLDDNLFSDTLFGHVKGAFTGAMGERCGLIEEAGGGTLFLDEIGDLDTLSQVKLLRLLQEGEYYPLGSDKRKFSDARIVVATHQNIQRLVEQGKFRQDLYYRLRTHHVDIPPLRERKCDLGLLLEHFIIMASEALDRQPPLIPDDLLELLESYHFPGNIRELEGMIFDAVSRSTGNQLSMEAFRMAISRSVMEQSYGSTPFTIMDNSSIPRDVEALGSENLMEQFLDQHFPTLKELNELLIEKALDRSHGNQAKAARMLGLSRQALNKRIKRRVDD
ncbi:hypothetical protein BVX99_00625 [bacterium F16]|nr:hypothetical protein BVX99_00625 [bacterium F16]